MSSITGLLYPMPSSLMTEILDNTQTHSSATLRTCLVRSVGLNETSYTVKTRLCLLRNLLHCKGKDVSTLHILFPLYFFVFKQTVSHLTDEGNVEQVFSRVGTKWHVRVIRGSSQNCIQSNMDMILILGHIKVSTWRRRSYHVRSCHGTGL